MAALIGFFGIMSFVIALMTVSVIWQGFVFSVLWGWFVVPIFNLPVLSIPYAIGLAIIVSFLTTKTPAKQKEQEWGVAVTTAALAPAFALLMGWIVKSFI